LLPLNGYETAIYEIYPVEEAQKPLIAGRLFEYPTKGENWSATRETNQLFFSILSFWGKLKLREKNCPPAK